MSEPDSAVTYARLLKITRGVERRARHNIKIGIIVPPSPFVVPRGWEFVHRAPFEGPSVIAAVLRGLGLEVSIVDQREDFDPEALRGGPLKKFDIIAMATYEDSFPFIRKAVEIAKEEGSSRPVILGGPLVTSAPGLIMENTAADYAVVGEGELTTIELMDLIMRRKGAGKASQIPGLAWKDPEGAVVLNPRRPQMRDLDAVPLQDFSVWPSVRRTGKVPEIFMTSSRGCPGRCTFCFRAMPLLRHKSAPRVRRELLHLKKYRYRFAWWSDLTFIDSRERIHRLMDEAFKGIDFRWSCFTRADGLDLEVLTHMRECGCDIVMYGFESITREILDYFRKKVTKSQITRAIELTRKAGLKVGGLFIIGGPGETRASLARTVEFCRKFREVTRVKYMSAIPGTPLYYDAVKNGIIKDELEHLYFLSRERSVEDDEILNLAGLPEKALRDAYRKVNRMIEVRPYEYRSRVNRFLPAPRKFKDRPALVMSDRRKRDERIAKV